MDAEKILSSLKTGRQYHGQVVHVEEIPARAADYAPESFPISEAVAEMLRSRGIERLYSHQVEAIEAVRAKEHVIVVTGAASGKSLCYNIPVLETLTADPRGRALYVFPTKALAQDQLGKLRGFGLGTLLQAATYDGDTPMSQRGDIRRMARIILTNPDMLHVGILPYHTTWSQFFRRLRYVVIDEVHAYRGVFGSHVGNIIRRLRRICSAYGSTPQFICASATIGNPEELMRILTGLDFRVVSRDGSPVGRKSFVLWNPPFIAKTSIRRSANSEASAIFERLVRNGVKTIVFTRARVTAELIARNVKAQLRRRKTGLDTRIMPYRAGYTAEQRRNIEQLFFSGELIGLVSTSAMELGIDVGGLDAVVMTGYPGSVTSTWQQAGRAGRGSDQSLAFLVAISDALDQYLMRHPQYLFTFPKERVMANPGNPYILESHVLCAAYELPIEEADFDIFGESLAPMLAALENEGSITHRDRWFWAGGISPAPRVNVRCISGKTFAILNQEKGGEVLGTVDEARAYETVHPGAVYLHEGESYLVESLDIGAGIVRVVPADLPYYTQAASIESVRIESADESKECGVGAVCHGTVRVTSQVIGYRRKRLYTDEVLQYISLELPSQEFVTHAVWLVIPRQLAEKVCSSDFDLPGSLHAAEHCSIGLLPLVAMCDRYDLGGVSHPSHPDLGGLPGVFIYDAYPGGVGIAEVAYERIEELLFNVISTVRTCPCEDGCPSCVQSPKCGNNNQPLDKGGAEFLLTSLLALAQEEKSPTLPPTIP